MKKKTKSNRYPHYYDAGEDKIARIYRVFQEGCRPEYHYSGTCWDRSNTLLEEELLLTGMKRITLAQAKKIRVRGNKPIP